MCLGKLITTTLHQTLCLKLFLNRQCDFLCCKGNSVRVKSPIVRSNPLRMQLSSRGKSCSRTIVRVPLHTAPLAFTISGVSARFQRDCCKSIAVDRARSEESKVLVFFRSDLLACMLPTFCPLTTWTISLEFCRKKTLHYGGRPSLRSML